ncbi:hypothetical protein [Streptomyces sp. SGAir0957]
MGCIVALLTPFVIVLVIAGVLVVLSRGQDSANARHKDEALRETAELADSYERDVLSPAARGHPLRPHVLGPVADDRRQIRRDL